MSESTTLREALARAIYESEGYPHHSPYLNQADAVLAVLADLPDDVIEQVCRVHKPQLWSSSYETAAPFVFQTHSESWDTALARARRGHAGDVRGVLEALAEQRGGRA